jgi:hypothetical protein
MEGAGQLVRQQHGVVAAAQAGQLGLTRDQMRHRVRRGSWRAIYPGVYATHPGELGFEARVWAAVLYAGPTSMASHRTAGRLQGLVDEDPDVIDLTLAEATRRIAPTGLRLHRATLLDQKRHPAKVPPQTRAEETVLDLVAAASAATDVVSWVLRACQRRLTTPARLAVAAEARPRLANRVLLAQLIQDVEQGVASALEHRYRHDVEVSHGLPQAQRSGAWSGPDGRRRYFDVRYAEWRLRVELEGLAYHPADRSWADAARDNEAVPLGDVVLRYGWRPVVGDPCGVAGQVGAVLRLRGWTGAVRRCGAVCRADRA